MARVQRSVTDTFTWTSTKAKRLTATITQHATAMSVIRVVWGTATGPTQLAAYDAALAEAGVGDYNLVTLSSVLPADPDLEVVGTAPDLGPVGNELRVVQSRADAVAETDSTADATAETAAAGVGWARSESGRGIFYEVEGADADAVESEIREGLAAGKALRDWTFVDEDVVVREVTATEGFACAVVLATYGESRRVM